MTGQTGRWRIHAFFAVLVLAALMVVLALIFLPGRVPATAKPESPVLVVARGAAFDTPTPVFPPATPTAFTMIGGTPLFDDPAAPTYLVTTLGPGEQVGLLGKTNDGKWFQVLTAAGLTGWAGSANFLLRDPENQPAVTRQMALQPDFLYLDDFSDPASGFDITIRADSGASYQGGEYVLTVPSSNSVLAMNQARTFLHPDLSVTVRSDFDPEAEFGSYGLVVHAFNGFDYYFIFYPNSGGYSISYQEDVPDSPFYSYVHERVAETVGPVPGSIRLRLALVGAHTFFYMNDTLLARAIVPIFDGPVHVGFFASFSSIYDINGTQEIYFDDLRVERVGSGTDLLVSSTLTETVAEAIAAPGDACHYMHVVLQNAERFYLPEQYGVTLEELAGANSVTSSTDLFETGRILCIPEPAEPLVDPPVPTPGSGSGCRFMHVAREFDELWRIEFRYGVSWDEIARASGTNDSYPVPGTKYCIP